MSDHDQLSDRDLDRMLSGRGAAPGDDPSLSAFLDELRTTYTAPPSDGVRKRHLSAMAAAVEQEGAPEARAEPAGRTRRAPARRLRIALVGAALLLALPLGTAGLATAGVTLPAGINGPFEALGIELPNQARAPEVRAVIEETPPGERGCAFGRRVARAAAGVKGGPDRPCPPPARGREPGRGDTDRGGRGGAGEPRGRGTQGGRQAAPDARSFGGRTAERSRELAPPPAQSGGGGGDARGGAGSPPDQGRVPPDAGSPGDARSRAPAPTPGGDSGREGGSIGGERSTTGGSTAEAQSAEGRSIGDSAADGRRP